MVRGFDNKTISTRGSFWSKIGTATKNYSMANGIILSSRLEVEGSTKKQYLLAAKDSKSRIRSGPRGIRNNADICIRDSFESFVSPPVYKGEVSLLSMWKYQGYLRIFSKFNGLWKYHTMTSYWSKVHATKKWSTDGVHRLSKGSLFCKVMTNVNPCRLCLKQPKPTEYILWQC